MDVKIGFSDSSRELELEMADDMSQDKVIESLKKATASDSLFWIEDKKGRAVGIVASKIAYIVVGAQREERRVGFGA